MTARPTAQRLLRLSSRPMSTHTTAASAPAEAAAANPAHNQIMKLPDGRTLGFAEYGDPRGLKTLLYFHGYPSSRVEAKALHRLAAVHSIRVLALDRPGYGLSTPQPRRQLLDWPRDVAAFADRQGLDRFAVLGASGGGPFAVVLANRCPGLLAAATAAALRVVRWLVGTRFVEQRLDAWLELATRQARDKEARRLERDPGARPSLVVGTAEEDGRRVAERRVALLDLLVGEPFAQGPDGAVQEARILTDDDWGFRLEEVGVPIKIWHGAKDTNAPIEAIRYLADRLPRAELHEFAEDTHYTMGDHVEEAVLDLMGENNGEEKV
ncbi:alpha/beta hydrolase fold-1 [Cordyceps fumosorosea ARSEF 2679]|uniref:Alpha/beta hydrolase fold-1 n=1 Tax=Cordyceps fumosorosea (strain ARSEF 2679) TaxID=1081104 RepID=A0A167PA13_CORFA|nr:alpha/beta hydrolase fold-1 [Cordyceps fumosorosea ARSEF 2679]OAA56444.1 alpha/beta hydrolase fold-1 [Cordyceps fumosorosea ARSEF 2679]